MLWYCQDFTVRQTDSSNDLPFDQATLVRHVERVLIASAPWQLMFMRLRDIYRWEEPRKTLVYLLCTLFLIHVNYVGTFGVSLALCMMTPPSSTRSAQR